MEESSKYNLARRWNLVLLVAIALIIVSLYSNGLFGRVNLGLHSYVLSLAFGSELDVNDTTDSKVNDTQDSKVNDTQDSKVKDTQNSVVNIIQESEVSGTKFLFNESTLQGLPSLKTMVKEFQRSGDPCPQEVTLNVWNGRIGNHYFQVSQILVFALLCGVSSVSFPEPVLDRKKYQSQAGMLLMPARLDLQGAGVNNMWFVPQSCPKRWKGVNWYHHVCSSIPAWRHWQVNQIFLRRYLGQNLTESEQRSDTPFSDADHVLTVHLRGNDVGQYPKYQFNQPPCSLYRRVILEHQYKNVTLIFSGRPVCAETFTEELKDVIQLHIPKKSSVVEDFALLLKAKHLFLAFSSFSISAALLSKEVKVLYRRTSPEWDNVLHSNLNCNVWPGVLMYEYKAYSVPLEKLPKGGPKLWLETFPSWNITGPYRCEYGVEEGKLESTATNLAEATWTTTTTSTTTTTTQTAWVYIRPAGDNVANSTLPLLSCDPNEPHFNKTCPSEVKVRDWNGRIGNHYFQISQAVTFALICGAPMVQFPKLIYKPGTYQNQMGMLSIPQRILLNHSQVIGPPCAVPKICPVNFDGANWYHLHCNNIPAWRHWQVMDQFLRPHLGQDLLRAEAQLRLENEAQRLTVHLRGEDTRDKPNYEANQPPCQMYRRILSDHGYTRVTVVKNGQTACDGFFQKLGKKMELKMQMGSVLKDFAALLRARNLALSFSSFVISAAILSKDIQVIYRRRDAQWDSVLHSILNCDVWPQVVMYEYNTTVLTNYRAFHHVHREIGHWLTTVPEENISGPFKCEHGSPMQSYM